MVLLLVQTLKHAGCLPGFTPTVHLAAVCFQSEAPEEASGFVHQLPRPPGCNAAVSL